MRSKKAFTLIELLVVIAIIAILSVVVILTLNPAELLKQSRDATRLSDAEVVNKALAIYATDVNGTMGSAATTYVSYSDPSATSTAGDQCQGITSGVWIPSSTLQGGIGAHCASPTNVRNVDGSGWVPVNFKNISSGSPLGQLPLDPTNATSTGYHYSYVSSGGQLWAVSNILESSKYLKQSAPTDGGLDNGQYEVGTSLPLMAAENGILGWWSMDDTGSSLTDNSGLGATLTASGTVSVGGKIGNARSTSISTDLMFTNAAFNFASTNFFVVDFWAKINSYAGGTDQILLESGTNVIGISDSFRIYDSRAGTNCAAGTIGMLVKTSGLNASSIPEPSAGVWHHYVFVANLATNPIVNAVYLDGQPTSITNCGVSNNGLHTMANLPIYFMNNFGMNKPTAGQIDDVRISTAQPTSLLEAQRYTATN